MPERLLPGWRWRAALSILFVYGVTCVSLFELIQACLTADGRLKMGCGLAFNCRTARIEAVSASDAPSNDTSNTKTTNAGATAQQKPLRTKAVQRFNVGWDPKIQQGRALRAPTGTELERHAQVHGVGTLFVAGNKATGPQRMSEYLEDLHADHDRTRVPFEAALERDFTTDVTELVVSTFEEDTWWVRRPDQLLGLRVLLVVCFLLVLLLGARIFCITEVLLEVNNFLVLEVKVALLNALEERALQQRKKSQAVRRLRENKRAIRKQERVLALARQRLIAHEAAAAADLRGVEEWSSDGGSNDSSAGSRNRSSELSGAGASARARVRTESDTFERAVSTDSSEERWWSSSSTSSPARSSTRSSGDSSLSSGIMSDATTERLLVELGLTTFSSSEASSEEEEESDDGDDTTRFYRMQLRAEVGCYASLLSSVLEKCDGNSMDSPARKFVLSPPQRKLTCPWIVRLGASVLCTGSRCAEGGRDPNLRLQSDANENDNNGARMQDARLEDDPELAEEVREEDSPTQVARTRPNAARRLKVLFRDAFHNRARMRADETLARMWGMLILHWNEVSRFLFFA